MPPKKKITETKDKKGPKKAASSKIGKNKVEDELEKRELDSISDSDSDFSADSDFSTESEGESDLESNIAEDDLVDDLDEDIEDTDNKPVYHRDDLKQYQEECVYNSEDDDVDDFEDEETGFSIRIVKKEDRITKNKLTKYERVRILGTRTKQLKKGAKAMIKNIGDRSAEEIAKLELEHNIIPFKIRRPLPDRKSVEIWELKELEK